MGGPGFPGGSDTKESACDAGDLGWIPGLDPWVGKIPWRRERLPTSVFWPGESHRLYNPWGREKPDTTERLSLSSCSDSYTPLCNLDVFLLSQINYKCLVGGDYVLLIFVTSAVSSAWSTEDDYKTYNE